VSARSKGRADVGRACVALGGGGHALAAGFTAHGTAAEVMTALREQLATGPDAPAVTSVPRGPSEPKERGAAWTEERGSVRPSDEGRRQ
jgi:hypothetical protein